MYNPLVSVVIPCYNQADYICETVDSVLAQTYQHIEIIIVNDGSTDQSAKEIEKILRQNPQIRYISTENGGVSKARNIGIDAASGELILPLDADDLITEDYIRLAVSEFEKNPELIVVTAQGRFFGAETGDWNFEEFSMKKMLHGNIVYCPSIFQKRDWQKVGGFDESMTHLEDWDFYIRLTALNPAQVKRLDYRALLYRIKSQNARNTEGFMDGSYNDTLLYLYTKNKVLFFEYFGNPSHLIKIAEQINWEKTKLERENNFFKKFFFNRILLNLRNKKHGQ